MRRLVAVVLLCGLATAVGCTPAGTPVASDTSRPVASGPPKKITTAIIGSPTVLGYKSNWVPDSSSGDASLGELVHAGLSTHDPQGNLIPQLGEAVPSLDNGLWKLFPDGRMETTWKIRTGARWHDGTPLTAGDAAFTVELALDQELGVLRDAQFALVESLETPDPQTITVRWKTLRNDVDTMFTRNFSWPLPRHILEQGYREDRANFLHHPYWSSDELIGLGPYKVQEWVRDSHIVLAANSDYVPGRPKIDVIEVRFIGNENALAVAILAGNIDLAMGTGLSLDSALDLRDRWPQGRMETALRDWIVIWPQFAVPNPPVVASLQFRRALMHAVDRQALVDTLMARLVPVADSYVPPTAPEYPAVESSIVRYRYDPARAASMIESLGYRRGPDGGFRDTNGQRLAVELRTASGDGLREKAVLAAADYWTQAGVGVDSFAVPTQRVRDREYMANFPGFDLVRASNELIAGLGRYPSTRIPRAENNWA